MCTHISVFLTSSVWGHTRVIERETKRERDRDRDRDRER